MIVDRICSFVMSVSSVFGGSCIMKGEARTGSCDLATWRTRSERTDCDRLLSKYIHKILVDLGSS